MFWRATDIQSITATSSGAAITIPDIEDTGGGGLLRISVLNEADPALPASEDVYLCHGTEIQINPRIIEPGASKEFDGLQWAGGVWSVYAASNTATEILVETKGAP